MSKQAYVYILTNRGNSVLYTGVTSDLKSRVWQHKHGATHGFSSKYRVKKLVYYEVGESIKSMIEREKQIKAGSREKKIQLVESFNPTWDDLYEIL